MQGVDPIGRIIQNLFTLQRIGNTIDAEGRVILDALHSQIAADIALINPAAPALQKWRLYRTDQLIDKVGERVGAAFPDWEKVLRNRLASAGRSQGQWASATLISSLGTTAGSGIIRKTPITQNWAKHILRTFPFGGAGGQHVLADWSSGLKDLTRNRIVKQLRLGMTLEESIPEMVRRIRGSQAGYMKNALGKTVPRFVGGVWKASTRDAESIVRTATTYVMSKAHLETFKANAHALLGIQFSAALDDRTTVICIGLDGSIWIVNSPDIVVPGEMTHFKCRSCLVPVPDYEKFGLAPPPDGFRKARDFSGLKPADLRRRMSTRRGKKLLGKQTTVSSKVTAEDWLRDQPQFVQAKMLGKERARLFREGKISLKEMVRSDKSLIPTRQLPGAYAKPPLAGRYHSAKTLKLEEMPQFTKIMERHQGRSFAQTRLPGSGGEDLFHRDLARLQGFDGTPQLVSQVKLDGFIAAGERELVRGVTTRKFAEQILRGEYYSGMGHYGNGYYMAHGTHGGVGPLVHASAYAGRKGGLVHMTLRKGARVTTERKLALLRNAEHLAIDKKIAQLKAGQERAKRAAIEVAKKGLAKATPETIQAASERYIMALNAPGPGMEEIRLLVLQQQAIADLGRFGIMRGFDAYLGDAAEFIVLNRTALRAVSIVLDPRIP